MTVILPNRATTANRKPVQAGRAAKSTVKGYEPPIAGVSADSSLRGGGRTALVIENFWPMTETIEPRGGSIEHVALTGSVTFLTEYSGGSGAYIAADSSGIYTFTSTTPDSTALTAAVTGQTGGDYSALEFSNSGGTFLTMVNGVDNGQIYDGTSWSTLSVTGVGTNTLSDVWVYRNRQFFIEKETLSVWYLGTNSIAGAAVEFPLDGVFNHGGYLLFGATLSSDSGDGIDDRCVFVTNNGEAAIYRGGDPSSASDWTLDGVFGLGRPLGRNHIQVGGDLVVLTELGLVSLSAAISKDTSQLGVGNYSDNISRSLSKEIENANPSQGWGLTKWDARGLAIIHTPPSQDGYPVVWAINLNTKAAAKVTGWDTQVLSVLGGRLYFGDNQNRVNRADAGGTDNGFPFECRLALPFDDLGAFGSQKSATMMRTTWLHTVDFSVKYSLSVDFNIKFPASPNAGELSSGATDYLWDTSDWDQSFWGTADQDHRPSTSEWRSVSGCGRSLAPQIQILSSGTTKLNCELVLIEVMYETGSVL